ncbi:hypothetical protein [Methylobacterium sp. CM6257]
MSERDLLVLALTVENSELRARLAEAQDQLVELAINAGQLHTRIEALQTELAALREGRNAGRADTGSPRELVAEVKASREERSRLPTSGRPRPSS